MNVIKITDLINPIFYSFWLNEKPNSILKGGRSSMKSSVISLKLVTDFIADPSGNVVILRKVAKYLSTSVYEQIKWAIYMLKLENEFYFGKSPLIIRHKRTNTAFYFYGCDDPMKIKSAKIAKGYVMALWFEELAEFDGVEDIDIVSDTFIRQDLGDKEVKVYYSYNPPRNPYEWVNEWVESKRNDPDYFIHHSTYLDDEKGFLSNQLLRKIEQYKENDYDYWRWMYNGEVIGLGDMVYNMNHFHGIDKLPDDDDILLIDTAIDTGHQVSATTYLAVALTKKQKVILLDTWYYSPENKVIKKAPSELSKDYYDWYKNIQETYKKPIDMQTIDSAEGALRNQVFKDYSIRLHPIAKKKKVDMIENVYDLLAQGRFFYLNTKNNEIFIEEHKRYQWDPETLQSDDPKVIKENDHTCDAFQYYINDNLQKLGLKY
ncbi:terminase [Anoxybacillus sp. UARK-01]|uniref:PBSX family phage terminase large subunit n=1 Tax=Anoxybacillus sp. UARK-01 TaxID=1895648 RepID=UPI0009BB4189|nr:PBSX family phage terminase large subunit [Anoxybacillus sp. UARK-01]OQM47526.1 terminase [Anoxybacillus sp. UARK-01]